MKLSQPSFDQFIRDSWLAGVSRDDYRALPALWAQRAWDIYNILEQRRFALTAREISRMLKRS
jgi:hypothetical protein